VGLYGYGMGGIAHDNFEVRLFLLRIYMYCTRKFIVSEENGTQILNLLLQTLKKNHAITVTRTDIIRVC
jgi:hypothetical protein